MGRRLAQVLFASTLAFILLLNRASVNRVSAQADNPVSNRGVIGDVLDSVRLSNLVENLYFFRNMVVSRGGLDSQFLNWFMPFYAGLSGNLLNLPAWPIIRFIFLPAAVVLSVCLSLYPQIGLLGAVLTAGFLIGLIYVFPIFLVIEVFSKTGLIAKHSKTLLVMLLLLTIASTLSLLFAYGYYNMLVLFCSFVMLSATLCFAWFLPILLYYQR